jgi:hypothetical protein
MADNKKMLADLLACLAAADSTHVLIGGLAAGHYGKKRATVDVDMLVPKRAGAKLQAELERRGYRVDASQDMMRVYRRGSTEAAADLVWREAHPTLREASRHTTETMVLGHRVNLVDRGAFVALKWHAAISIRRGFLDKQQDVVDIGRVLVKAFTAADEKLAVKIAEKTYPGGGADLARMLDDLRHERPVKV